MAQTLTDFHIGYIGTAFLALCFMVLGAGVMYSSGVTFAQGAGGFANQVLTLYTNVLGQWSAPFIGISAIAVMFSTTLAVLDGFPRASAKLLGGLTEDTKRERKLYGAAVLVLSTGSILVLWGLLTSLKAMVDIATTLSFLTAPLLAILNHRAMMSDGVPQEARPKGALRTFSLVSIVVLVGFALFYLGLRLFAPT